MTVERDVLGPEDFLTHPRPSSPGTRQIARQGNDLLFLLLPQRYTHLLFNLNLRRRLLALRPVQFARSVNSDFGRCRRAFGLSLLVLSRVLPPPRAIAVAIAIAIAIAIVFALRV